VLTAKRAIAEISEARARPERLTPRETYEAQQAGATLIDIRPELNRESEGLIVGALIIERPALERHLDPASSSHLPIAAYDLPIVVICNEGCASRLAAASLQDLGLRRATDLIGGFRAWRALGLPTRRPR
jgi:rhodanese-related sulfurtransferase